MTVLSIQRFAAVFALLVGLAAQAGEPSIDPDLAPRMAAQEVEAIVHGLSTRSTEGEVASNEENPSLSIRATRADRLGAPTTERGEPDTRTVWVVELKGEAGEDGAFYVLDDQTGAVLAHGVVSAK